MVMSSAQQVFLLLLSNARHNTERTRKFYEEISRYAPYADIKADFQARAIIAKQHPGHTRRVFSVDGSRTHEDKG
jgi:hypothetical protein